MKGTEEAFEESGTVRVIYVGNSRFDYAHSFMILIFQKYLCIGMPLA